MNIEQRREGRAVVVSVAGRLDAVGAKELEACIRAIVEHGDSRLVIDCAAMPFISSGGLRAVLVGAKICKQLDGALVLAALRPECRMVVEVSGFLSFLDHHETVDAALAAQGHAAPAGVRTRPAPAVGTGMDIEERREREHSAVVLSLVGRLDGVGAAELEARVGAVAGRGDARVVLDCGSLGYINSTGLRALLKCARACQGKGGKLVLADRGRSGARRPGRRSVPAQMSRWCSPVFLVVIVAGDAGTARRRRRAADAGRAVRTVLQFGVQINKSARLPCCTTG